ncbi:MAG: TonB-dependent receptor, partial [Bacteroidales bacterium]|nr:TonB-dependent receptor [Bacteroidales bacterium]
RVTGTVSDEGGDLMPGVNIIIRGTTLGTTTDINGEFALTVPSDTTVLLFRFVGYRTQEMVVGNRKIIAVSMQEAAAEIGEVVVVAFGTQKKQSVIGAISTINPAELKVPSSNLTTALAGNMSGVIAYQRSGEPGQDNADFFVRGITTFGTNTNPLILIDGIELSSTDLARLRPDDIESFSVLKDATATALYGARGANGVVLVTTKQGTVGPAKISFRFENSFSAPTRTVAVADPVTYMKMNNEAILTRTPGGERLYSQEKIEMTEAGRFPLIYPANDWKEMLFKDHTMNQRANMSVSGGGGVARYYVAGSFNRDNGILKVDKRNNFNNNIAINNYDLRANVNIDVTKITELIVRLSANFEEYKGPLRGGTDMYNLMVRSNPVRFPAYFPVDEDHKYAEHILFGNWNNSNNSYKVNPYAEMVRGYKEKSRSQILAQVELKQDLKFITEGLNARGMMNISRLSQFAVNRSYNPFYYEIGSNYNRLTGAYKLTETTIGTEYLRYDEIPDDREQYSSFYFEGTLNYVRDFGKHNISSLLVYQARQTLKANAGSLELSLPSRSLGLSGRATYSYDSRYFAEFNFGYNGSERFDKDNRFGFFPSAGAAWVLSNEQFWENIKPVVNNLKLRYSYGVIGNDQIGDANDRFFYLSRMDMDNSGRSALFGLEYNVRHNGIRVNQYANPYISWETSTKQNFALELGLWNKLSLIAEYFTEYRSNILMDRASIPNTMGLESERSVRANVGEASGKGVDLTLEYQQNWNTDFWTSARANFTYAASRYEVYEEPEYREPWRSRVGWSLRQESGYIAERLFVDDEEAAGSPPQSVGNDKYGGGDIKYTDVNRDGRIDAADRVPLGYPTMPEIIYGFGFSMGYKGFDLSAMFQGAARQSFWINAHSTAPFIDDAQILQAYADSYWSEETQNVYAIWPRLDTKINGNNVPGAYYDSNGNQQWSGDQRNTWFMRNAAFLRLKQVEFGYTLPARITEKIRMSNLRFYVSGTNLFLLSKFKMWDVEMAGNGLGYPLQRVFNVGVNLTFN